METNDGPARATGGCLCGGVRYEVRGPLGPVYACHCSQCRRASGHDFVSTSAPRANLRLITAETLRWYESSPRARRGFCATCGSLLFWDAPEEDFTCFTAGSIDQPTGLKLAAHIFVADKGDYYEITDSLPRWPGSSGG